VHEPNQNPTVYLAAARSHGWVTDDHVAEIMWGYEWPQRIADYKQSELIDITAHVWPDVRYLWVVRNPADTVASMVRNRWFLPSDDNYPPGYLNYHGTWQGQLAEITMYNSSGNRTRGDYTGDYTAGEWAGMGQVERCGWWWAWINTRIGEQLEKIPGRAEMLRVEDHPTLIRANSSTTKPVTGWESYVGGVARKLGYDG